MRTPPQVVIAGSLNIDYIATVRVLPRAGETVKATELIQRFGGKGANQAVAAARQGARVAMIGCLGADDNGRAYRARLDSEGVDTRALTATPKSPTGTALIAVDHHGENTIIVAAGANAQLGPVLIRRHAELIRNAKVLLLQFEIPMLAVREAVKIANRSGVPVVLNPSPWCEGFPWGEVAVDTLIANSLETRSIFGGEMRANSPASLRSCERKLRARGLRRLIVTRGSKSTLYVSAEENFEIPTLPVRPVDTVGAGDAFAGAYAAARAEGLPFGAAIRRANVAGGLATLKSGAQESIPGRSATMRALARLS